jgi:hypothetical protein
VNVLLCIDGTGIESNVQYAREFADSHVHKIWLQASLDSSRKRYMRGPTALGSEMDRLISSGYQFVRGQVEAIDPHRGRQVFELEELRPRVLLAGHSRGAASEHEDGCPDHAC